MNYETPTKSSETEPRLKILYNRLEKSNAVFAQLNEDIINRLNSLMGSVQVDNQKLPEHPVNCALDELHRLLSLLDGNLSALETSAKRFRELI